MSGGQVGKRRLGLQVQIGLDRPKRRGDNITKSYVAYNNISPYKLWNCGDLENEEHGQITARRPAEGGAARSHHPSSKGPRNQGRAVLAPNGQCRPLQTFGRGGASWPYSCELFKDSLLSIPYMSLVLRTCKVSSYLYSTVRSTE
jgi:hypothetical protein